MWLSSKKYGFRQIWQRGIWTNFEQIQLGCVDVAESRKGTGRVCNTRSTLSAVHSPSLWVSAILGQSASAFNNFELLFLDVIKASNVGENGSKNNWLAGAEPIYTFWGPSINRIEALSLMMVSMKARSSFFFIKAISSVGWTLLRRSEWVSKNSDSSNGEKSGVAEPPSLPGDRTWTRATQLPLHCGIVGAATHGITAIQVSHSRQHTTPPPSLDSFSFHNDPVFRIDKLQAKYFKIRMSNNSFLGRMR